MKKMLSFILSLIMVIGIITSVPVTVSAASVVDSGICGENVSWTLDSEGVLTIRGSGPMYNYYRNPDEGLEYEYIDGDSPWYENRKSIKTINIDPQVTHIGNRAFYECMSITELTLPEGVETIGYGAFGRCLNLETLSLPDSLTQIEGSAFSSCEALKTVFVGTGLQSVGGWAFDYCRAIKEVHIKDLKKWLKVSGSDIGKPTFYGADLYVNGEILTDLVITSDMCPVANSAMVGCGSLRSVSLPTDVADIGGYGVFSRCRNLSTVIIPDNITFLGGGFSECYNIDKLVLGKGLEEIRQFTFENCNNMSVFFTGTEEEWKLIYKANDNGNLKSAPVHYGTTEHTPGSTDTFVIRQETCVSSGEYREETDCSVCGKVILSETKTVPALEHIKSDWVIGTEASCYCQGYKYKFCEYCGETLEEQVVPALEHIKSDWVVGTEANCNCQGYKYKFCEYCGETLEEEVIPAFEHIKSDWIVVFEPDCERSGYKYKVCESCNEIVETKTTPANGHIQSDWIIDDEAGTKYKNCTVCGEVLETAEIPQLKPATPKLTSASRVSNGVKVTWGEVEGADSYIVYRKTSKSGWTNLGTTTENTFTDTKAKTGSTYYYTVKAQNEAGASGYNKTGLKIKFVAAPKLTKIANESSGVRVYWGKVSGADGYYLYRRVAGSKTWTKIATIKKGSTTSYLDKKASGGKTYEYIIKCYDGSTPSASAAKVTKIKRLTVPKLVSTSSSKTGITFKWGKVSGAEGYYVYRKTGSGSWVKLTTVKGNTKVSYVDKSAKKGKTYTYTVKAYSGSYTSAYNTKGLKIKDKY